MTMMTAMAARASSTFLIRSSYYCFRHHRVSAVSARIIRHLGNGARLERIDWLGDPSPKGIAEACGLMVNYLYAPGEIERNHEAYANRADVIAARSVRRLLPRDAVSDDQPLGWLTGAWADNVPAAAYKFAADHPAVGTVLTGTGRIAHLDANAEAILGTKLPPKLVERAIATFGPVSRNASF